MCYCLLLQHFQVWAEFPAFSLFPSRPKSEKNAEYFRISRLPPALEMAPALPPGRTFRAQKIEKPALRNHKMANAVFATSLSNRSQRCNKSCSTII